MRNCCRNLEGEAAEMAVAVADYDPWRDLSVEKTESNEWSSCSLCFAD